MHQQQSKRERSNLINPYRRYGNLSFPDYEVEIMSDSYVPANGGPKSLGILGIDRKDGESTKLQAPGPSGIEKDVANVFEGCVKFTMNGKSIWCAGGTSYKAFDDFKKVIHVFRSLVWRNNEKVIVKSVIATYTKPFEYTSHYVR